MFAPSESIVWLFMFISKPLEAQLFLKSDAVLFLILNSLMLIKGELVIIESVGIYFNTLGVREKEYKLYTATTS